MHIKIHIYSERDQNFTLEIQCSKELFSKQKFSYRADDEKATGKKQKSFEIVKLVSLYTAYRMPIHILKDFCFLRSHFININVFNA